MRIVIEACGEFVAPSTGPRGRELEYVLPADVEWEQVSYGQGEGQIRMLGCQWGISWEGPRKLSLEVESGQVPLDSVMAIVSRIGNRLFGKGAFQVLVGG